VNTAHKPIVVVGSINMDLVARTRAIPQPGETVRGGDFAMTPGGKGANQAVAVAKLGYPLHMIGMVGGDVFGRALLDSLTHAGADVTAVERLSGPSGVAMILLDSSGQNSIVVVPGANGKVDAACVDRHADLLRSAGMVLLQLEIPMDTIAHVLALCAQAQVPVMLDPAPAAPLPASAWTQVAWFTPNETEAASYLGGDVKPEDASKHFLAKGLRGVVLKRGAEGAYVATAAGDAAWVPAFPANVVDTVGAGDCFNGAFAVALLQGRAPIGAARFASAAAAISVTRSGAQASMPTLIELGDFLALRGIDLQQ
jgi:ribokinase